MALLNCPECGRSVSTEASACPGCGFPVAKMMPPSRPPPVPPPSRPPPVPPPPIVPQQHPTIPSSTSPAGLTKAPARGTSPLAVSLLVILLVVAVAIFIMQRRSAKRVSSNRAPVQIDENGRERATYEPTSAAQTIVDAEVSISEDHLHSNIIKLHRAAVMTVEVELLSGPAVETWLLDEKDYAKFEKAGKSLFGGNFNHYAEFRMVDVRHDQKSAKLASGTYYVVVDNTDVGSTMPPMNFKGDTAKVRVIVTAE